MDLTTDIVAGKIVGNTAPFAVTLYSLNHDLWSRCMICEPVNIDSASDVKRCNKCGEFKALTEFAFSNKSKGTRQSYCKTCKNAYNASYRKDHKDYFVKKRYEHYQKHKEFELERCAEYYRNNREDILEQKAQHYQDNKDKRREYSAKRQQLYPEIKAAHNARRRAYRVQATPAWLTKSHKEEMNFVYWFANGLNGLHGLSYQVDHVHALKGENFSGLHVPWNLRVMPSSENSKKRNKPPEEEHDLFFHFTMKELEAEYDAN
jgi:hypothetical protein